MTAGKSQSKPVFFLDLASVLRTGLNKLPSKASRRLGLGSTGPSSSTSSPPFFSRPSCASTVGLVAVSFRAEPCFICHHHHHHGRARISPCGQESKLSFGDDLEFVDVPFGTRIGVFKDRIKKKWKNALNDVDTGKLQVWNANISANIPLEQLEEMVSSIEFSNESTSVGRLESREQVANPSLYGILLVRVPSQTPRKPRTSTPVWGHP